MITVSGPFFWLSSRASRSVNRDSERELAEVTFGLETTLMICLSAGQGYAFRLAMSVPVLSAVDGFDRDDEGVPQMAQRGRV